MSARLVRSTSSREYYLPQRSIVGALYTTCLFRELSMGSMSLSVQPNGQDGLFEMTWSLSANNNLQFVLLVHHLVSSFCIVSGSHFVSSVNRTLVRQWITFVSLVVHTLYYQWIILWFISGSHFISSVNHTLYRQEVRFSRTQYNVRGHQGIQKNSIKLFIKLNYISYTTLKCLVIFIYTKMSNNKNFIQNIIWEEGKGFLM